MEETQNPDVADIQEEKLDSAEQEVKKEPEKSSKSKVMEQLMSDDDSELSGVTLGSILGGDIFNIEWFKRQLVFLLMIVVMIVCYITNRYKSQSNLIKIEKLNKELVDMKYQQMTRSSQLIEKTRESKVVEYLKGTKDSMLKISSQQPYKIRVGYINSVK